MANLYKFDRTAFKGLTAAEADKEMKDYKKSSLVSRFRTAMYLNSIAFDFSMNNPPEIDRTAFEAIARK